MNPTGTDRSPTASWLATWRCLLKTAGGHAAALRNSLLGLLAAAIAQGLALACLFPLFRAVLSTGNAEAALYWLAIMSLLAIAATLLRWRAQGFEYNGQLAAMTHALRTRLGEQLRRMPLERLQDSRTGEMSAVLLGNVDENLNYTLAIANLIMLAVVTPLTVALAALFVDWRLGVMLLLIFPVILPLYGWRRPAMRRGMRQLNQAHRRTSADIVEYLQGLPVLRAACSEGAKAAALHASFQHLETVQTETRRQAAKPDVVVASVVELGLFGVAACGITWVVMGTLDIASLAATLVIIVRFSEPLATFVSYTMMLEMIEAALERIETLLAVAPLPQQTPAALPDTFDIRFEDVSFRYTQAGAPALAGFSAMFPACSMTALVGPSGAGKTTVTRLLMRYADPQQGRITLGGTDLRQIPSEALNGLMSVVFQDVYLFDDSVLANIRMARPEASEDEVRAAAKTAQCLAFIERLPQGWHTRLGEIGDRLSGGERQRISIARALLKNAPIVILDEPTAALDAENELAVQHAIDALVRNRTVIVIAHRLSTIVGADRILVVEDGQLIEQGQHDELLVKAGRYRTLWDAQQTASMRFL
ncbi:ABC transporter ATP-binding protein [Halomonas llamarensis]|uniref:ABC transporter ATP-binding protein/permease n=1 Tax=Halomonas llamarensis TaxID=2945104 RepID=A0ABT0SRZ5_9GAMM|nr:ABC transporter ATP-binding protein [Halomonas llamarensis]MCL7930511.1 ABC transporter ATP-binding protein/permease [Halomonas llamarensis]